MSARFRDKIRDRNLGRVESKTYPANQRSIGSIRDPEERTRAKLARHALAGTLQGDEPKSDDSAKGPETETVTAPEKKSKPKSDDSAKG